MADQSDQLLKKRSQSAHRLQCSIRKIDYLIEAGELEAVHDGRSVRIVAASEDKYVEKLRQREIVRRAAKAESKAKAEPAAKNLPAP